MASKLDKALDEVIEERRSHTRSSEHRGSRNRINKDANRSFVRTVQVNKTNPKGVNSTWSHDKFFDQDSSSILSRLGTRNNDSSPRPHSVDILVENLHYNVTEPDIKELFATVGDVQKAFIIFDRSGRSTGVAKVKFNQLSDAEKAIEKYNNVEFDGQPMHIKLDRPRSRIESRIGRQENRRNDRPYRSNGRPFRDNRRDDRQDRQERQPKGDIKVEDLDKQMDSYMSAVSI
ncbi:hypothetical protein BDB01DRAFT_803331 [Pilobolus umbonatus]|nr:hypothetical protein BDB01DRAFT_803331 [Pilobolus umbonatus]